MAAPAHTCWQSSGRSKSTTHPSVSRRLGVTVLEGSARFTSPSRLEVYGHPLEMGKAVIATGSRSVAPPIPGLPEAGYWTHVEAVAAEQLPESVIVLGAGPIGLEFAQIWRRFGVRVTVVERLPRILFREDAEVAELVRSLLAGEGLEIETGIEVVRVDRDGGRKVVVGKAADGREVRFQAAQVFVAAGRAPNLEELNLAAAGVEHDRRHVWTDAALRTTARNIWAAGDAAGPYLSLLPLRRRADYRRVPWTIFLDPEVAHLGATEEEARDTGKGTASGCFAMP